MTAHPESTSPDTMLILGEVRGQLREIIHRMNNKDMVDKAVSEKLSKLESVPATLEKIEHRLTALEADKNRRDGAIGLGNWFVKSPFIAWLVAAAMTAWAYVRGGHQ